MSNEKRVAPPQDPAPRAHPNDAYFAGKGSPFDKIVDWDRETLKKIVIGLTVPVETTSEFTRKQKPTERYWKSTINFHYKSFESDKLRFSSIPVPYVPDKSTYGVSYAYGILNSYVKEAILSAAASVGMRVDCDDPKLVSNETQWWKTINKIERHVFSLRSNGHRDFVLVDQLMQGTEAGVQLSGGLMFTLKYSTTNNEDMPNGATYKIGVEAKELYVVAAGVAVAQPTYAVREKVPTSASKPVKSDAASDELLELLRNLGVTAPVPDTH
jgi:hypothetical protein